MAKLLHNNRLLLLLFGLIALAMLLVFASVAYSAANNHLLMPLDDVYIHFQYAKQMALGQPYVYNPGQSATSGATSFLYPYLLAVGYLIGFKGLWLGLWAMLLGTTALIVAQWAVYRLCLAFDCPQWLSVLTVVIFAVTGSVAWHFMSGMETGLMITLTLWTLFTVVEKRFRGFIVAATLLALMRPEGGILAMVACATMVLRLWRDFGAHEKRPSKRYLLLLLLIPIAAIGVQPLVNLIMTGSTVATGNQAKSILATVPHDWSVIIGRIVDNFLRMWWEFVTGYDGREGRGWYLPLGIGLLGLSGIVIMLFNRNWRLIGLMLLGWLLATSAAISTLDTAFWHFKRYQMPMLVLFFPLAAFTVNWVLMRPHPKPLPTRREGLFRALSYGYLILLPIFAVVILLQFISYHRLNVSYVYQQPYQMALWLRENTPEDAVIAVHDVGLMRYMGERTTLDIVGLTTPGAAAYWRNGPGSVAEFLINEQPDYIASYGRGHGYGLAYLADTSLYGEPLASFPIENWNRQANVALAADFQGIYQPDWETIDYEITGYLGGTARSRQGGLFYTKLQDGNELGIADVDSHFLNVADIESELNHDYEWGNTNTLLGFSTEVHEFSQLIDGYRRISGYEEFTIDTEVVFNDERQPGLLATRVHAQTGGSVDIFIDGEYLDTQWIPEMPGQWFTVWTYIPIEQQSGASRIRIEPRVNDGVYMPAYHAVFAAVANDSYDCCPPTEPVAVYQNGSMQIRDIWLDVTSRGYTGISGSIEWYTDGTTQGDYRFFLHVYSDVNEPPIYQWDGYKLDMPLGNWLPGTTYDRIGIYEDVAVGTYEVAIGFYNPSDQTDRLIPTSDVYEVSPDGRLWLGEITIVESFPNG